MQLQENISLKPYNTFGIDVTANKVVTLSTLDDLAAITALSPTRKVLGGGSNVLLTKPVSELLVVNKLQGLTIEREDESFVWVRVAAGEVWHQFVLFALRNKLNGIENLALIPGTVGAAPIQNIGAYGIEVKDVIDEVTGWHWQDKAFHTFSNNDCGFGYRDSIFKKEFKDKFIITSVCFKLNKKEELRTTYGAISQELEAQQLEPTAANVARAVMSIRRSKLPDPAVTGNAGSFFKNPVVDRNVFEKIKTHYLNVPLYPVDDAHVKVPAGWLIETAGWKGKQIGQAGVHARQALVLVNYGNATGNEIYNLSTEVIADIASKFGITLEREVQIW